jgi:hypothetical protein
LPVLQHKIKGLAAGRTSWWRSPLATSLPHPINFDADDGVQGEDRVHGMRLFGNMFAGELIFMLIA